MVLQQQYLVQLRHPRLPKFPGYIGIFNDDDRVLPRSNSICRSLGAQCNRVSIVFNQKIPPFIQFMLLVLFLLPVLCLQTTDLQSTLKIQLDVIDHSIRLPMIINSTLKKSFSLGFVSGRNYYFSNECPDFAKTPQHNPLISEEYEPVTNTQLYTPNSFYSFLINNDSHLYPLKLSNKTIHGLKVNFSSQTNSGFKISNLPALAILQIPKDFVRQVDGYFSVFDIAKSLKQQYGSQCDHLAFLTTINSNPKSISLNCLPSLSSSSATISVLKTYPTDEGYIETDLYALHISGSVVPVTSRLQLTLDHDLIQLPESSMTDFLFKFSRSSSPAVLCTYQNHELLCSYQTKFTLPPLVFELSNPDHTVNITHQQYAQKCYYDLIQLRYQCKLKIIFDLQNRCTIGLEYLGQTVHLYQNSISYDQYTQKLILLWQGIEHSLKKWLSMQLMYAVLLTFGVAAIMTLCLCLRVRKMSLKRKAEQRAGREAISDNNLGLSVSQVDTESVKEINPEESR